MNNLPVGPDGACVIVWPRTTVSHNALPSLIYCLGIYSLCFRSLESIKWRHLVELKRFVLSQLRSDLVTSLPSKINHLPKSTQIRDVCSTTCLYLHNQWEWNDLCSHLSCYPFAQPPPAADRSGAEVSKFPDLSQQESWSIWFSSQNTFFEIPNEWNGARASDGKRRLCDGDWITAKWDISFVNEASTAWPGRLPESNKMHRTFHLWMELWLQPSPFDLLNCIGHINKKSSVREPPL